MRHSPFAPTDQRRYKTVYQSGGRSDSTATSNSCIMSLCKALLLCAFFFARAAAQRYEWSTMRGSCAATCGPHGVRPALVFCRNAVTDTVADIVHCLQIQRPPVPFQEPCNRRPCEAQWAASEFGACSAVCNGVETRQVTCRQLQGDDRGIIPVEDDVCKEPRPVNQQACGRRCITPKFSHPLNASPTFPIPAADAVYQVGETVYVHRGNQLTINAIINEAYPSPVVTWALPTGTSLSVNQSEGKFHVLTNGSLVIPKIKEKDEGVYTATAKNSFGTDTAKTSVIVVFKPSFETPLTSGSDSVAPVIDVGDDITVRSGTHVSVQARLVQPDPNVTIVWRIPNGEKLASGESSGKYTVLKNGTLKIRDAQTDEAGHYRAVASSLGGSTRASTRIFVIAYEWVLMDGECTATCGSSGERSAVVSCKHIQTGRIADMALCQHFKKPAIPPPEPCNRKPCQAEWVLGDFGACSAACSGVQTRKAHCKQMQGDGRGVIEVAKDQCEESQPVEQRPCGLPCIAPKFSRRFEGSPSFPIPAADVVYQVGKTVYVYRGNQLTINGIIKEAYPSPALAWTLPTGAFLFVNQSEGKFQVLANGSLVIRNAQESDNGIYTAAATNSFGTDTAKTSVHVVFKPSFETPLTSGSESVAPVIDIGNDITVRSGTHVSVQARLVQLDPNATIVWTLSNGKKLASGESSGKYTVLKNGTLKISDIHASEAGNYSAVANSLGGSTKASTRIIVISYEWVLMDGECTATCGPSGEKSSLVFCKHVEIGSLADMSNCQQFEKPEIPPAKPCNRRPCQAEWVLSDFGACSAVCSGVQTREVRCRQLQGDGRGVIEVAEDQCEKSKPVEQKSCGLPCITPKFSPPLKDSQTFPVSAGNVITQVGETVYVREGYQLTIDAILNKGYPSPTIGWTLPTGLLLSANDLVGKFQMLANGSLILPNVRQNDEGLYTAAARNIRGADTQSTHVIVVSPPSFVTPRTSRMDGIAPTVDIGADVIVPAGSYLSVQARLVQSDSNTTVTWTPSDRSHLARGESSGKYSVLQNDTLTISNIQAGEAGVYAALATSLGGSAAASSRISVIDYEWTLVQRECTTTCGTTGLQITTAHCVEKAGKAGVSHSRCIVAGLGNPPSPPPLPCNRITCIITSVSWDVKDWQPDPCRKCKDLQEREVQCKRTLSGNGFSNTTIMDDEMICVGFPKPLDRQICNERSCSVPPKFRLPPTPPMPLNMSLRYNRYDLGQSVIGVEGRLLFIDAVLTQGSPKPKVFWTLSNGDSLQAGRSSGRFTVFRNGTLRITDVRAEDRGEYKTKAINEVGEDEKNSMINIYVPPVIDALNVYRNFRPQPKAPTVFVRPGDTVALQCRFRGVPVPSYTWVRDGSRVSFNQRTKVDAAGCLIITDSKLTDSGKYECVVQNMVGVATESVTLNVENHETYWDRMCQSCSKTCRGGTRLCVPACRDLTTGQKLNDAECSELKKPLTFREKCNDQPCSSRAKLITCSTCSFGWRASQWNANCTSECRRYRQVKCFDEDGKMFDEGSCSPRTKPSEFRKCRPKDVKPIWKVYKWSSCSRTCGGGKQKRRVKCVNPCTLKKRKGCSFENKPDRIQSCNLFKC